MRLKAIGAFIAIRLLSIATLALIAESKEVDFQKIFFRWDAQWYRRIAQDGYGYVATAADGRADERPFCYPAARHPGADDGELRSLHH